MWTCTRANWCTSRLSIVSYCKSAFIFHGSFYPGFESQIYWAAFEGVRPNNLFVNIKLPVDLHQHREAAIKNKVGDHLFCQFVIKRNSIYINERTFLKPYCFYTIVYVHLLLPLLWNNSSLFNACDDDVAVFRGFIFVCLCSEHKGGHYARREVCSFGGEVRGRHAKTLVWNMLTFVFD